MPPVYVELHCHSYYSLLDGASSPAQLVERAAALGMSTLALTDHDNVYGVVAFQQAAQAHGIRHIFGAELTLAGGYHLTLLVKNAVGWTNLCHLITLARQHAPKGEASLPIAVLEAHTSGLIALSGCRSGELAVALHQRDTHTAKAIIERYRAWFGRENYWIELQHHLLPDDAERNQQLTALARRYQLGCVATNNVHYADPTEHRLQDVLTCIRHNLPLDSATQVLRPNSEYYLKSGADMAARFAAYPEALANTLVLADQCQFELRASLQDLPAYPLPDRQTPARYLRELGEQSPRCTTPALRERLHHELAIIERAGLANYFLIVWDMVRYAREQGIRCQGRGSAANSVTAYLLFISPINPIDHDLVFERFLSDERQLAPDIDVDFDAARREEVIQYIYARYGRDHAAMACTVVTFRARSAIRDVAKALGYAPGLIELWTKAVDSHAYQVALPASSSKPADTLYPLPTQVVELCQQIQGLPRHVGIHNGGMILTRSPLSDRLPTEPATMPDRTVVQWDKDALEEVGMVKVDILGLRMLSLLSEAAAAIGVDLDTLTYDDPQVYARISAADTIGVFQVESRAQSQMLPRFQPRNFNDLIIAISLIRPGPLQGDMVHPYLRRRLGEEPVSYLHPRLKPALQETLGVILFQEQVLKVARDVAGFTAGQGELLRRALGKKDATTALLNFQTAFIQGAERNGVDTVTAQRIFRKLLGFGSYSFPKSHAAAFAVLVYQSAWLRHYYPAAFYTALLNHQPMGFWQPSVIVNTARQQGIKALRVDVNHSQIKCTLEQGAIRIGLNYIKGLGSTHSARLVAVREQRLFPDFTDFCRRTRFPMRLVENIIQSGACDGWRIPRRTLLWQLGTLRYAADELDLSAPAEPAPVPDITPVETLDMEYTTLGLSTEQHILALYRPWLLARRCLSSRDLEQLNSAGQMIQAAGLVVVRQAPPTAKGFQFLTLEDEFGFINVIVRPLMVERYRLLLRATKLVMVQGEIQREREVVNVVATRFRPLPTLSV
jgi:error-prone DNA polymerase